MCNIERAIFIQTVLLSTHWILPCLTKFLSLCLQAKKFVGVQLHNWRNQPLSLGWSRYEPLFGFSTFTTVNYISMLEDMVPYVHYTSVCVSHSPPQSLFMTSYKHISQLEIKTRKCVTVISWHDSPLGLMNLQCGLERNQPQLDTILCIFLTALCHLVPQKSRNLLMFVKLVWMAKTKAYIIVSFSLKRQELVNLPLVHSDFLSLLAVLCLPTQFWMNFKVLLLTVRKWGIQDKVKLQCLSVLPGSCTSVPLHQFMKGYVFWISEPRELKGCPQGAINIRGHL